MKRGEIWWANLGPYRPQEQTGRRPVIIWQSDALNRVLQSVLVVPLTTNLERARLAGTAFISSTDLGPPNDSVALAFQRSDLCRLKPRVAPPSRLRSPGLTLG
ncbi:MAG TPA: type II toxin-antitoxin system PemK/MazF family toxin [Acidobacteriota bacterium]|nr:type II toxin-antitoxin system PemK/MazF family toxin [Acidobacteriota bacterium]